MVSHFLKSNTQPGKLNRSIDRTRPRDGASTESADTLASNHEKEETCEKDESSQSSFSSSGDSYSDDSDSDSSTGESYEKEGSEEDDDSLVFCSLTQRSLW